MGADIGASVLARLKNTAAQTGRSFQLCLQLFCQEEFLRRLERSRYAENFVLKGGLFLYTLTNFKSRITADVDFLLRNLPNTQEKLAVILEEIISVDTDNGFVTFEIVKMAPIAVESKYAGIGASLIVRIKNTRTGLRIDFGVGDTIVPPEKKRAIPVQLPDFSTPVINTYSLETVAAEKLDAILTRMSSTSRMKDFYDLWYLANHFEFDKDLLAQAFQNTFKNRNHKFTVEDFEQIRTFNTIDDMSVRWTAFTRKNKLETDDLNTVLEAIQMFFAEPFASAVQGVPPAE